MSKCFGGVQTYIPSHEDTFKGKTYTPIMKYNPELRAQGYSVGPRGRVSRITNLSWDGSPIGNAGTDSACHNRILSMTFTHNALGLGKESSP